MSLYVIRRSWNLLALSVLALVAAACTGAAVPKEALAGVEARAYRRLFSVDIGSWVPGASAPLKLEVIDAKLAGGKVEHRAYLVDGAGKTSYLGALQRQLPDAPVESLLFTLDGARFLVFWVDESVAGNVQTVTVGRPLLRPDDDSMSVLRAGGASNRIAAIPVAAGEAQLWDHLADLLIYTGGLDFAWKHTYQPPLLIQPLFQDAALPK